MRTQAKPMQTEANSSNNNSTNLRNSINSSNNSSQQQNNQTTDQKGVLPKSKLGSNQPERRKQETEWTREPRHEMDAASDEEGKKGKKPPRK